MPALRVAAATVSSSTLAAATLSAGIQSILPRYRLCSLSFCKLIPEDFLEFITGNIATPEECTAFHVVIVREMVDDMSPGHNLGLVDFEARKHVRGIINAIDPYQGVFPPHTKSGIPPFACEGSQISRSLDLAEQPFLAGTNIRRLSSRHSVCLLYTSPSPRDQRGSRMPSSA